MMEKAKIRTKSNFWSAFLAAAACYVAVCALVFPERTARSVSSALSLGVMFVVPSLAAFSMSYKILAPALVYPLSKMKRTASALSVGAGGLCMAISGMFSGFPMGAVVYAELKRDGLISEDEGRSLMPYSNNAGAAFLIGSVGANMFGDAGFGAALFAFQTLSALTMLVLTSPKRRKISPSPPAQKKITPSHAARAVAEGGMTMIGVLSFIVFFSVLGDAVSCDIPLGAAFEAAIRCALEISGGAKALSLLGRYGRAVTGFAVGFSGISVFLQADFAAKGEAMRDFLFGKTAMAALCGTMTFLYVILSEATRFAFIIVFGGAVFLLAAALFSRSLFPPKKRK